jgi:hypothetical protein
VKTFILLFLGVYSGSVVLLSGADKTQGDHKADSIVGIFENRCVKCHGEDKIKGDINLVAMLDRNISFDDIDDWSKVFAEVQSGNMPPEDEEEPLTGKEGKSILLALRDKLGESSNVKSERMITPDEYKNSIADLFQLDLRNYDPIGDLYSFVTPEHRFCTVESNRMMNRFYFSALMDGTERILREYHADNEPPLGKARSPHLTEKGKQKQEERIAKNEQAIQALTEELLKKGPLTAEDLQVIEFKKYGQLQGRLEGEIARRTPRSTNYTTTFRFPMKMSPKIKDTTDGFFEYDEEYWGIRGKSWIENNNMPIMLLGGYGQQFRVLPPGKYRLTIKATAVDRDTISAVPKVQSKETAWSNNNRLEKERCKLVVYKDANRTKTKSDPLTHATPVGAFHIEDDKIRDYTLDVSFHWHTQLGILFENGVTNVINAEGKHPVMRYDGNDKIVYTKAERKLPTIRIYDVTLEKLGDVAMGNLYIKDMSSFDDQAAKEKIQAFAARAYLNESSEYTAFYDALRESGCAAFDAYADTMKWLFLTSDYLYIDSDRNDFKGLLRYAAYSLLKTVPSESFAKAFAQYNSGQMSTGAFADHVVSSEGFNNFVLSFAKQWLQFSEIDQNAPDRVKYSAFYDDDLEEDFQNETSAHIKYLFTANRKLSELVEADYHFINDTLAVLYGIEDVRNNEVRQVEASAGNRRMGILSHGGFMAATSNGVEDLPFRRAKWISENILDKTIPPPPDEIDVTAFGKAQKQDFSSRIEAHINSEKCGECHKLIDPIAIDIHMFDGLGRFKKEEFAPDVAEEHLASLKEKISTSERRIASAFTKNLLTFINGRRLGINDLLIVNQIMDETKRDGYRARDILEKLIANYFPQQKQ